MDRQCGLRTCKLRPLSASLHDGWLHRRRTQMNVAGDRKNKRHSKYNCKRREYLARWNERRAHRRNFKVFFAAPIDRRYFWMAGRFDASPASGLQTNGFISALVLESCV